MLERAQKFMRSKFQAKYEILIQEDCCCLSLLGSFLEEVFRYLRSSIQEFMKS